MNEPRRLREDCESNLERALLEAGASYGSSARMHAKTLGALGLAGSAALSAGTASGISLSSMGKAGWTKLIATISAVGAAAAVPGYYVWHESHRAPAERSVNTITISTTAAAREAPARSIPMAPVAPVAPIVPADEGAAPQPQAPTRVSPAKGAPAAPAKVEPRPTSASADLVSEVAALDAARGALANGDPKAALSLLDTYDRTYPRGRLALEAEVLRMDALAKSGQHDAAEKRAEAFLRRHPKSVLAPRVRGYLSD